MPSPLILASNSPRRSELLRQIGLAFTVDPADVDERVLPNEPPEAYAVRVALDKAKVAAARAGRGVVIAADTVVVLGSELMGKPADAADAKRMLSLLSGKAHRVVTGLVVRDAGTGRTEAQAVSTNVWFRDLRNEEIDAYVASGEPLDKAGAYGIQEKGALLVDRIEGCFFNVVGLPLSTLGRMLDRFAIRILGI
jgi:septum formation protein